MASGSDIYSKLAILPALRCGNPSSTRIDLASLNPRLASRSGGRDERTYTGQAGRLRALSRDGELELGFFKPLVFLY